MAYRGRNKYLELAVVAVAIVVLYGLAMDAVWKVRRSAEEAAVKTLVWQLRSALAVEAARRAGLQDWQGVRGMAGMNPMTLLVQPPANYRGEIDAKANGSLSDISQPGTWHFARDSASLVYRTQFLGGAESDLRFQVRLVFADNVDKDQLEAEHSRSKLVKRVSLTALNNRVLQL